MIHSCIIDYRVHAKIQTNEENGDVPSALSQILFPSRKGILIGSEETNRVCDLYLSKLTNSFDRLSRFFALITTR
jgi:hypothetical protein